MGALIEYTKAKRLIYLYRLGIQIPDSHKFCISELSDFFDFDTEVYKPNKKLNITELSHNIQYQNIKMEYFNKKGEMLFFTTRVKTRREALLGGALFKTLIRKIIKEYKKHEVSKKEAKKIIELLSKQVLLEKGIKLYTIRYNVFDYATYETQSL